MENYKQLIKDFMLIECENNNRYMIFDDSIISVDFHFVGDMAVYNDELKHIYDHHYDVKRIYTGPKKDVDMSYFDLTGRSVYWERPKPDEAALSDDPESFSHNILLRAIKKYGLKSQITKTVEELSELSQALCKALIRLDDPEKASDFTCADLDSIDNIFEEMADVEIMLSQCRIMFRCDTEVNEWELKKIQRLSERLNNE
jgi:hypothetical protein